MNSAAFRLLLTGANGQVGSEVSRIARDNNISIHAFGRDQLDITNTVDTEDCIVDISPDIIINAAAYTAVDKAEEESELAFAVNKAGAANLAVACTTHAIPLLHISTDYIFDGSKTGAYTEDDPAAPLGVYGQSKWQGEEAVRSTLEQHIILRVAWVFGATGNNFVKTMLRLGQSHTELRVVDDQHGGPTPARAIAQTLISLVERYRDNGKLTWGTFHYCGTPATSWCGFAREIFSQARAKNLLSKPISVSPIATADYPTPAQRPMNSVLDGKKLDLIYNIAAPDWKKGLAQVLTEINQPT